MPPFAGTDEEKQVLAAYLALLGGAAPSALSPVAPSADVGKAYYDTNCAACHGPDGLAPFDPKGRKPAEFYEMIGRLPAINEMMPAFEGTEEQRRALADHLASLPGQAPKGGAQ
jgi:mono/diheme cytochrome c family protein